MLKRQTFCAVFLSVSSLKFSATTTINEFIFFYRTLLAEINSSSATNRRDDGDAMSVSSDDSGANYHRASGSAKINDKLKIVSTQSTARPGAVVELEPIEDAKQVMLQTYNYILHICNQFII